MWWNKLSDDIAKPRTFSGTVIIGDYNFPCKCKLYSVFVCCIVFMCCSYMVFCSCVFIICNLNFVYICMCVCTYVHISYV